MLDIHKSLDRLGLPIPAEIERVLELRSAIYGVTHPALNLEQIVLDATLTVKETVSKLQERAAARAMADSFMTMRTDLTRPLDRAMNQAIRSTADTIFVALQERFDQAAAQLQKSIEVLGPDPAEHAVLNAGPQAHANWQSRKEAIETLRLARSVRAGLGKAGWGPREERVSWYIAPVSTLAHFDEATQLGRYHLATLADAGLGLRLNNLDQIAEIESQVGEMQQESKRTAEAAREASLDAHRARSARNVEAWAKLGRPKS